MARQTAGEPLPPHNTDAEQAVLGACLADRDAILRVAALLDARDFYLRAHSLIFRAMLDLYHERVPVDLITLVDELARRESVEEAGGEAYLAELIAATPTSVHAEYYAGIVRDHAVRRRLIAAGQEVVRIGFDTTPDPAEQLIQAEAAVQAASRGLMGGSTETLGEVVADYIATLDDGPPDFLRLGYHQLDERLGGLERGDVAIIAGRPSHGKSAFAFGAAMNVAVREKRVLVLSLEMTNRQLMHRALAFWTGIDSEKIRHRRLTPDEREIVREAHAQLDKLRLHMTKAWGDDISVVTNQIRAFHAARTLDLLVIDGLWLLRWAGARGNRVQEVGTISRTLKILAGELEVPILLCHQLNRAMLARGSKDQVPQLSDLRESGDVEQDADVVLFVHRPGMLDPTGETPKDYANIVVAKHRQGQAGFQVNMYFEERTQTFRDHR